MEAPGSTSKWQHVWIGTDECNVHNTKHHIAEAEQNMTGHIAPMQRRHGGGSHRLGRYSAPSQQGPKVQRDSVAMHGTILEPTERVDRSKEKNADCAPGSLVSSLHTYM